MRRLNRLFKNLFRNSLSNLWVMALMWVCPLAWADFSPYPYLNYLQNLKTATNSSLSVGQQTQQLQQQIKTLVIAAQNTQALTHYHWQDTQSLINQLQQISAQQHALSAMADRVDAQFNLNYPNYSSATNRDAQQAPPHWQTTTLDTLRNSLNVAHQIHQHETQETALLNTLNQQGQQAQGRLQALQVATELSAEQIHQLHTLKQLMITQLNAQTAYQAALVSKASFQQQQLHQIHQQLIDEFPTDPLHPTFGVIPTMRED